MQLQGMKGCDNINIISHVMTKVVGVGSVGRRSSQRDVALKISASCVISVGLQTGHVVRVE